MIFLIPQTGAGAASPFPPDRLQAVLELKVGVIVNASPQGRASFDKNDFQTCLGQDVGSDPSTRSAPNNANIKFLGWHSYSLFAWGLKFCAKLRIHKNRYATTSAGSSSSFNRTNK